MANHASNSISEYAALPQQLEIKRTTLLNKLRERMEGGHTLGSNIDPSETRRLQGEYNSIIESQAESQRGPLPDPLEALPTELCIDIFQRFTGSFIKPIDAALRLTLVSFKWRDVVLRIPQLWSRITIGCGVGDADMMDKIHFGLYFSANSPLTLLIEHPTRDWQNLLQVLMPHVNRIRGIVMQKAPLTILPDDEPIGSSVSKKILSFGLLPALQYLDVKSVHALGKAKSEIFPNNTPLLQFLRGTYLQTSLLLHPNFRFLRGFACEYPLDMVIPCLIHLPHLQSLHLGHRDKSPTSENVTFSPTLLSDWTSPPLRWLIFQQPYHELLIPLICKASGLTSLKVETPWEYLVDILSVLPMLPILQNLKIRLKYTPQALDVTPLPDEHLQCLPVTELQISFDRFPDSWTPQEELDHCCHLFQVLEACAKDVQDLSIIDLERADLAVDYITSLTNLRELCLYSKHPSIDVTMCPLALDKLEVLHLGLRYITMAEFLSSLRTPNLSRLDIYGDGSPPSLPQMPLYLDNTIYSRLRSINWGSDLLAWDVTSLRSLTSITFKETTSTTSSDFCVYVICRPSDFPALKEITFENLPEWDCLLLMLERRNFLPEPTISRIRALLFPLRTTLFLRKPIVDLLRGCFTLRPSNHELSLAGIKEVYFDKTM
jgi:hypothetical protein